MKRKTFFDYQCDPNYVQDVTTGEFTRIKTGRKVRFTIGIKKLAHHQRMRYNKGKRNLPGTLW
mgnify:CR=1 FL=1